MPGMKAKPNNQVILINSSFFVYFSFSQNKGKGKKNTPPDPYPTELKLDTLKVSQEAKTELTSGLSATIAGSSCRKTYYRTIISFSTFLSRLP